jgi:tetratricopeptide (TPR) repeat protein
MSKKKKSSRRSIKNISSTQRVEERIFVIQDLLISSQNEAAIEACQQLLDFLPARSPMRAEVLGHLATAHGMLRDFPSAYNALTEALELDPNNGDFWFNRGMTSRFTARIGQSVRDFERAAELLKNDPELAKRAAKELKFSQRFARSEMKRRGPNFTLDQLIEQEDLFQRGMDWVQEGKWEEGEQVLRRVIEMGDCLPQPWSNLGLCLMKQRRYDEAEAAFKRALQLDRRYQPAKINLAALAVAREKDDPDSGLGVMLPAVVNTRKPFLFGR